MLYVRTVQPTSPPALDKQAVAMLIHSELKKGRSPTDIYRNNAVVEKIRWVEILINNVRAIEAQMYQAVRDNPDITPVQLRALLSHPWLDLDVIGQDVVNWSMGKPEKPPTFAQFKTHIIDTYGVTPEPGAELIEKGL